MSDSPWELVYEETHTFEAARPSALPGTITKRTTHRTTHRMPVSGGWLYRVIEFNGMNDGSDAVALCFVPGPSPG